MTFLVFWFIKIYSYQHSIVFNKPIALLISALWMFCNHKSAARAQLQYMRPKPVLYLISQQFVLLITRAKGVLWRRVHSYGGENSDICCHITVLSAHGRVCSNSLSSVSFPEPNLHNYTFSVYAHMHILQRMLQVCSNRCKVRVIRCNFVKYTVSQQVTMLCIRRG